MQPTKGDYASFYEGYIQKTIDCKNAGLLGKMFDEYINTFISNLPENKANYAYEANKWSVKEVVQHLIDTERIFSYRLLRIVRQDPTPLPGFDENHYVAVANAAYRNLEELKAEWSVVRNATKFLIKSMIPTDFNSTGNMNGNNISANALVYIIYGHVLHHIDILKNRYNIETNA